MKSTQRLHNHGIQPTTVLLQCDTANCYATKLANETSWQIVIILWAGDLWPRPEVYIVRVSATKMTTSILMEHNNIDVDNRLTTGWQLWDFSTFLQLFSFPQIHIFHILTFIPYFILFLPFFFLFFLPTTQLYSQQNFQFLNSRAVCYFKLQRLSGASKARRLLPWVQAQQLRGGLALQFIPDRC